MNNTSNLLLLRHGPTNATTMGAPLGKLDLPVNSYGQTIWPQVRKELLELNIQQVITSNLCRARDHAIDLGIPYKVIAALNEQDFGAWDGLPWSSISGAQAFFTDPINNTPPNGESFRDCVNRVSLVIKTLSITNVSTLILAHSGSLRIILAYFLGIPIDRILDFSWQPYGLSKINIYDNQQRGILRYHNISLPLLAAPTQLL